MISKLQSSILVSIVLLLAVQAQIYQAIHGQGGAGGSSGEGNKPKQEPKKLTCHQALAGGADTIQCEHGCKFKVYKTNGDQDGCINDMSMVTKGREPQCVHDRMTSGAEPIYICFCFTDLCNTHEQLFNAIAQARLESQPATGNNNSDDDGNSAATAIVPILIFGPLMNYFM